jgi:hypothetical protein
MSSVGSQEVGGSDPGPGPGTHSARTGERQEQHGIADESRPMADTDVTSSPMTDDAAAGAPPASGRHIPLLDLRPGDRVLLPAPAPTGDGFTWLGPVTVTDVVLVDSGLVQVRYEPQAGESAWSAHLLILGPAFEAGARSA